MLIPLLAVRGQLCSVPSTQDKCCIMTGAGFSITAGKSAALSKNFVLGLLNSTLLFWRLRSISNKFRGGWITCTKHYVQTLPIRTIDFSNPADKRHHDEMVALVERMLDLHKKLPAARTDQEKTALQRQIADTDRGIDRLVYDLYGLTDEEIAIVEGTALATSK